MATSTPATSGWRVFGALSVAFSIALLVACGGGGGNAAAVGADKHSASPRHDTEPDSLRSASGALDETPGPTVPPPSGGQDAAPAPQQAPRGLRGFHNFGNTCAISSLMQVLMHDADLRRQAQDTHPDAQLDVLHAAYIDDSIDPATFNAIYRYTTLSYLQRHHAARNRRGTVLDVTELWNRTDVGLGLPLDFVMGIDQIDALRRQGQRVIGFMLPTTATDEFEGQSGYASYADLLEPNRLRALVVNTGGHFVSYVHIGTQWWYFSDSHLRRVSDEEVRGIRACERGGIVFAVYQP